MSTRTLFQSACRLIVATPIALAAAQPTFADIGGANGTTELVSVDANDQQGVGPSSYPEVSEDGRYVVFESHAALVPGDTNGVQDIYRKDRTTGLVELVSTTAAGILSDQNSFLPAISADARWIVFSSLASTFEPLDPDLTVDIFRKDMLTGALVRVSNAHLSAAAGDDDSTSGSISDDGRYVAFSSTASDLIANDTNLTTDVFLRDMQTGVTQRLSSGVIGESNGPSHFPRIAGNGTRVVFESYASNLVLFDGNNARDVFVVEPGSNPVLLSKDFGGNSSNGDSTTPDISSDGSRVVFMSWASDLVNFDINGVSDVFVVDVDTLATERVSLTSLQGQLTESSERGRISRDGAAVLFVSEGAFAPFVAPGHSNLFVRDLAAQRTWAASRASGTVGVAMANSLRGSLAAGGSIVAFSSHAEDFSVSDANGDLDVFVRTTVPDPSDYGAGSVTSAGCQPTLTSSGHPSATNEGPFLLEGSALPNQKAGAVFYGLAGSASIPFAGATLHVAPPLARSTLVPTFGNLPAVSDCSGFIAYDMNAFAAGLSGGNPRPELTAAGQRVNAQFWGRDPDAPSGTFLTGAVEYWVGP